MAVYRFDLETYASVLLLIAGTQGAGIRGNPLARRDDNPGGPDEPGESDESPSVATTASSTSATTSIDPTSIISPTAGSTSATTSISPASISTAGTVTGATAAAAAATVSDGGGGGGGGNAGPEPRLDDGSIAGIILGVILGVIFLAAMVYMFMRRLRRRRRYHSRMARDPNNPHLISEGYSKTAEPDGDASSSGQSPLADANATRPWFDIGPGSAELPAETRGFQGRGRTGSWGSRKVELPTPVHPVALVDGRQYLYPQSKAELAVPEIYEVPDAKGTRFSPVELPAAVPWSWEHGTVSSGDGAGVQRDMSWRTHRTWGSSTHTWVTASPTTDTSMPERGLEDLVSPYSPCEGKNPFGRNRL